MNPPPQYGARSGCHSPPTAGSLHVSWNPGGVDPTEVLPTEPLHTAPAMQPSALVLGRYRLEQRLGAGGFGVVWRARDERLERPVAVKVMPHRKGMGKRAEREALAAARLNHPAIVTLYEAGSDGDAAYLVSELVEGEALDDLLADGALSDRDIARIGAALAAALDHAHGHGVIHRDVKPGNVIVPERAPRRGVPGQAHRLRRRPPGRRRPAHAHERHRGHAGLHGARAGRGRGGRGRGRPVLARPRRLRGADRGQPGARGRPGRDRATPGRAASGDPQGAARSSSRARRRPRPRRAPVPGGARLAARARGGPRRVGARARRRARHVAPSVFEAPRVWREPKPPPAPERAPERPVRPPPSGTVPYRRARPPRRAAGPAARLRRAAAGAAPGAPLAPEPPRRRRSTVLERIVAAVGAAGLTALGAAAYPTTLPIPIAALAAGIGVVVFLLPRLGWMTAAVGAVGVAAAQSDGAGVGVAIVLAAALFPVPFLLWRAPAWWSVPVVAPLLGLRLAGGRVPRAGGPGQHRLAPCGGRRAGLRGGSCWPSRSRPGRSCSAARPACARTASGRDRPAPRSSTCCARWRPPARWRSSRCGRWPPSCCPT